jgi:hypothetical protein
MTSIKNSKIAHWPYDLFLSFNIRVGFTTSLLLMSVLICSDDVFIGFIYPWYILCCNCKKYIEDKQNHDIGLYFCC